MAFLWNPWNILTRMYRSRKKIEVERKYKMTLTVHQDRDNQFATRTKFLNIKYVFY